MVSTGCPSWFVQQRGFFRCHPAGADPLLRDPDVDPLPPIRSVSPIQTRCLSVRKRGGGAQVVQGRVIRPVELSSLFDDLRDRHRAASTMVLIKRGHQGLRPGRSSVVDPPGAGCCTCGGPRVHRGRTTLADRSTQLEFSTSLRLYQPRPETHNGTWTFPPSPRAT